MMVIVVVVVLPAVAPEIVHSVVRILKMAVMKLPRMSVRTIIPIACLRSELLWIAELRSRRVLKAMVMMVLVLALVLRLKLFSSSLPKIAWVEIQPSRIDLWRNYVVVVSLLWLYSLRMFPFIVIVLSEWWNHKNFRLILVIVTMIFYSVNMLIFLILLIFLIWSLGHFS